MSPPMLFFPTSSGNQSGGGGSSGTGESNALLSKLGSSLFGATGSPQKVVTNIRGFLSNRLTSVSIPDTVLVPTTPGVPANCAQTTTPRHFLSRNRGDREAKVTHNNRKFCRTAICPGGFCPENLIPANIKEVVSLMFGDPENLGNRISECCGVEHKTRQNCWAPIPGDTSK
ncbi:hypothetical protein AND_001314 [Anopheles darlingi]|uniref:Uncharacterized protein n=1 Tax=Anopheles darlingi TaxID=43151 RepID=W5JUC3_ANODA|nr:hypothetical protein AND_001314 [Anopheles darlingi]